MPWNVKKDSRCPASKPWAVVGGASGNRVAGCHPTEDAAKKQQAAQYVNEVKGELNAPVPYTTAVTLAPDPQP
jgi:hypothetical protein